MWNECVRLALVRVNVKFSIKRPCVKITFEEKIVVAVELTIFAIFFVFTAFQFFYVFFFSFSFFLECFFDWKIESHQVSMLLLFSGFEFELSLENKWKRILMISVFTMHMRDLDRLSMSCGILPHLDCKQHLVWKDFSINLWAFRWFFF